MSKKILRKFFPFSRHPFLSLSLYLCLLFVRHESIRGELLFREETSDEFLPVDVTGFFEEYDSRVNKNYNSI